MNILIGLISLSIIILIHEFGHFLVAKARHIHVERLSLFMGKPILSFWWHNTEFALGYIPIGGYCKMKGEDNKFQGSGSEDTDSQGSFYAASPLSRILVAAAGPGINILSALLFFTILNMTSYHLPGSENRIIIADDYRDLAPGQLSPAKEAGLQSGDYIKRVNNKEINTMDDLREQIVLAQSPSLEVEYERDAKLYKTQISPEVNPQSLRPSIGVFAWEDPVFNFLNKNSKALELGWQEQDRILKIANKTINNTVELWSELSSIAENEELAVLIMKGARATEYTFNKEELVDILTDISFEKRIINKPSSPISAFSKAISSSLNILQNNWLGIKSVISGRIKARNSLAGPVQISSFLGSVARSPFLSFSERFIMLLRTMAMISLIIAIANLLPIPVLDGGLIIIAVVELIKGSPLSSKNTLILQSIGTAILLIMMGFVLIFELMHYLG